MVSREATIEDDSGRPCCRRRVPGLCMTSRNVPGTSPFDSFASIPPSTPTVNENILCHVVKGWTSTAEVGFQFQGAPTDA
ncbi:MAG: hypothetical protein A4E63_03575 [Syntrophorhabdus sp. PtaU1.Bin050]|jgi:hypothetical protein|nr:MAG: hypothetical protein A4E63_03575 [Syntrophorhabdus sp. PtaU1.Bin050]